MPHWSCWMSINKCWSINACLDDRFHFILRGNIKTTIIFDYKVDDMLIIVRFNRITQHDVREIFPMIRLIWLNRFFGDKIQFRRQFLLNSILSLTSKHQFDIALLPNLIIQRAHQDSHSLVRSSWNNLRYFVLINYCLGFWWKVESGFISIYEDSAIYN